MKNFRFLGVGLASLFWFVSISASAFTFANGDIVTIKSGTYYLSSDATTSGSYVTNSVTALSEACLWRVSMTSATNFQLYNVKTGWALAWFSAGKLGIYSPADTWTVFNTTRLKSISSTAYYVRCSSGSWTATTNSNQATALTVNYFSSATVTTTTNRSFSLSPTSKECDKWYCGQDFTPTSTITTSAVTTYTDKNNATSNVIGTPNVVTSDITTPVSYVLSGDAGFVLNAHSYDRAATVTAQANSSYYYRNGLLTGTITFPDGTVHTAQATIRQAASSFQYTRKRSEMTFTPTSYEFSQAANSYAYFTLNAKTYVTTYTAYLNGTDTVILSQSESVDTWPTITNLTYTLSGNSAFAKSGEGRSGLNIYTTSNNTSAMLLTATLTATGIIDGVTYTATAQCVQVAGLIHQKGASNRSLQANGMQGVHTLEEVVYVKAGTSRVLELPVPTGGGYQDQYYRWYNYDTDLDAGSALTHTTTHNYLQSQLGGYGDFMIHGGNPGTTSYTMPYTPVNTRIAVDVSRNSDYVAGTTFTEPTLSYRVIYDIRDAKEMAKKMAYCEDDNFLEEYTIVAPTGATISIGPKYKYTGTGNNYFVNENNPNPVSSPQWKIGSTNLNNPTVIDNRLIQPPLVNTPQTIVYTLSANSLNIAKFTVVYKDVAKVGPVRETLGTAIINNADLDKRYTLVEKRTFDYTDGGTGNYYPNPLPWNEVTYGFDYRSAIRYGAATTDWGEYNLMRTTTGSDMTGWLYTGIDNRGGKDNGYFFYVDASEKPGKVADLKINGNLCPGTTIYFSAWVADLATSGNRANLNFVVSGIRNGQEEDISMFTTGVMKVAGAWTQVFFDLQLNEEQYDEYRLRIVNNGASSSGNDFAIDDIRIYVSKPLTTSFQAIMACGAKEDEIVAVLRADYDNPLYAWSVENDEATFYYQWQDEQGKVLNLNYLNETTSGYGHITLNHGLTIAQLATKYGSSYVYESLQAYLGTASNEGKVVDFFFVNESAVNPETGVSELRPILYIINRSAAFQLGYEYKSVLVDGAPIFDTDCGNVSSFVVQPRSQLTLNNDVQRGRVVSSLCSGETYEVSIRVFDSNSETMSVVQGYCYSDYYYGDPLVLDNLTQAIWAFRLVYPTATTFSQPVTGVYTQAYKDLLTAESAKFDLYKRKVSVGIPSDGKPAIFVVWPISGTGVLLEGSGSLVVCNEPVRVTLMATASLTFGPAELPEALVGAPSIVRLSVYDANNSFNVPIRTKDGAVVISEVKLYASTDPAYNSGVVFNLVPSNTQPNVGESIALTPKAGNTVGFSLKGGYTYEFYAPLQGLSGNECAVKAAYFKVNVVPDVVVWKPLTDNRAWNNDANWASFDGVGQGFVPLSHTNVIIENASSSPALPTSPDAHTTEIGSQAYITYDLNYEKWNCENIYFRPGGMLLNQHKLNYTKAWVDMKMGTNHWELMAAPMKGVVSGDMYIPKTGDTTQPFQDLQTVDNRVAHYPFWHSVYNKETYDVTTNTVVTVTSTAWTDPVNYLGNPYLPGTGFALWGEYRPNASLMDSVVVRFPKTETSYRYFSSTKDQPLSGDRYLVNVTRPADYGKLGFEPTEADGETMKVTITNATPGRIFLVGNPLMANLDLALFFAANPNLSGTFWLYDSENQTIPMTPLNGLTTSSTVLDYIPPMRSFLVQTTDDVQSLTLNFRANMANIIDLNGIASAQQSPARMKRKSVSDDQVIEGGILRIDAVRNGVKSRAIIAQNNEASRAYVMGEDAELLMLDVTMTPAAIYSVADNMALSINAVSDIDMIPLAFRVVDKSKAKHISLQFNGVNSFNETLYLYDAYTGNSTQINEGASFDLEAPLADEMRYYVRVMYISTDVETSNSVTDDVTIYNKEAGSVLVYTSATIEKLTVFNMAGQMVEQEQNLWTNIKAVNLPTGVYLFEIVTDRGVANKKVLVR
ncbi:MAG: T9SS type A sorting domain-containing protein [Paludibacteraceae bacterium]|nr:T9SS type A sorting domain-containing protein [Paludibacteraceae bacterium]